VKFGTVMHIRPPNLTVYQKFQNPRWRMAVFLKIEKLQYLQNRLADYAEILYNRIFVLQSLPAVQKK